jgi:hypothetical protein
MRCQIWANRIENEVSFVLAQYLLGNNDDRLRVTNLGKLMASNMEHCKTVVSEFAWVANLGKLMASNMEHFHTVATACAWVAPLGKLMASNIAVVRCPVQVSTFLGGVLVPFWDSLVMNPVGPNSKLTVASSILDHFP